MSKENKGTRTAEGLRGLEENGIVSQESFNTDYEQWKDADTVREPLAYGTEKGQGEYTLEDYYAWPKEQRVELIDGVIYVMEAPYIVHQDIAGIVHMSIYEYIRKNKGKCKVFEAPVDVRLCRDEKTMVQPDVLVICDRNKITGRRIEGAPDFVLEIISESTQKKDMGIKLIKYREAGVREYWIIDPYKKALRIYNFSKENAIPRIYPLEGTAPVAVFEGKLEISLSRIAESIDEFASKMD